MTDEIQINNDPAQDVRDIMSNLEKINRLFEKIEGSLGMIVLTAVDDNAKVLAQSLQKKFTAVFDQFNESVTEFRERDEQKSLYLHRDRRPLVDVDIEEKETPLGPFYQEECTSGHCFI